jgi:hypothetical protein
MNTERELPKKKVEETFNHAHAQINYDQDRLRFLLFLETPAW